MTPFRHLFAVGCLSILLAACGAPPESTSPLMGEEAAPNESLLGVWYSTNDEETMAYRITEGDAPGEIKVLAFVSDGDDAYPMRWMMVTGRAVRFDGRSVYNMRRTGGDDYTAPGEKPGVILTVPDIGADGTLVFRFPSEELLGERIEAGWSGGREVKGKGGSDSVEYVIIDLPSDQLAALIREVGTDAFFSLKLGPLHRLPATPEAADMKRAGN